MSKFRLVKSTDPLATYIIACLDLTVGESVVDGEIVAPFGPTPEGDTNPTDTELVTWQTEDGWADLPSACFEAVNEAD